MLNSFFFIFSIDINEIPLCESAVSCDNLLCDGHGRPPNPSIDVQIENNNGCGWVKYGQTEIIDRCANPQFLCTILFRASDGLSSTSLVRFTVYDVREKLSRTVLPLGYAEISLGVIQVMFRRNSSLSHIRSQNYTSTQRQTISLQRRFQDS